MKYQGPPPGYMTLEGVLDALGMTKQNFYYSGVADLLDFWQVKPNTPNLYRRDDVCQFGYWLLVRQGLIALGVWKQNHPLADPRWEAIVEEGYHDCECPACGEGAIVDDPLHEERVWCPNCGIQGGQSD